MKRRRRSGGASPAAPVATPAAEVWPDHDARFYARALDGSDYGAAVATALAHPRPASLLDIGAGASHPVTAWLPVASQWTALEPSRYLRARLGRLARSESRLADWHFRAAFPSLEAATAHCAERLALAPDAPCRAAIADHLAASATWLNGGGLALAAPKRSALLLWDL